MVRGNCTLHDFEAVPSAQADPILDIIREFSEDVSTQKVNLSVGAYRTADGRPHVFRGVREAEKLLASDPKVYHEYLPQDGMSKFNSQSAILIFGKGMPVLQRSVTVQTISGTGALSVGFRFLKQMFGSCEVWISDPSWPIHKEIVNAAGYKLVKHYRYVNYNSLGLDFTGMVEDLSAAPRRSIVILHPSAHNPSGVQPDRHQWLKLLQVIKSRNLLPFFDSAYQGLACMDLAEDAWPIRLFAEEDMHMLVSHSFSKIMGLYGERVGSLTVVSKNGNGLDAIRSQLKTVARSIYSTPPSHGANIVSPVFSNDSLFVDWKMEVKEIAQRMVDMRLKLYIALNSNDVPGSWDHIIEQKGMFIFTGLSKLLVRRLKEEHHVYMTMDGRMCVAALNDFNIQYIADAIKDVLTISPKNHCTVESEGVTNYSF